MIKEISAIVLFLQTGSAMPAQNDSGAIQKKDAAGYSTVQSPAARPSAQETLDGIITNQTITVAGQDFYQAFSAFWHDKPLNDTFAIAIRERPSARRGNRIRIEYADRTVFETVLPPSRSSVQALSESAAQITYDNVMNANVQRLLFRDDEFAPDEF